MVTAKSEDVKIGLSRSNLNFTFSDVNNKMYTEQKITLKNKGNADAYFEFLIPEGSVFSYQSNHNFVTKKSNIDVVFRYTP